MRVYNIPEDYQHIAKNGSDKGWTKEFIRGQQKLAYMSSAPWDTMEMVNGNPVRFYDLTKEERQSWK